MRQLDYVKYSSTILTTLALTVYIFMGTKIAFLLGPGDLQDFAAEKTHSPHFLGVNMTVFIIFCRKTDKKRAKKEKRYRSSAPWKQLIILHHVWF